MITVVSASLENRREIPVNRLWGNDLEGTGEIHLTLSDGTIAISPWVGLNGPFRSWLKKHFPSFFDGKFVLRDTSQFVGKQFIN